MSKFFQFESEFVNSLRCVPMRVRLKLDTCGVKMKLSHWNQLTQEERKVLISMSCETPSESAIYRNFLQQLITEKTGEPAKELPIEDHPAWLNEQEIPQIVQEKAAEFDLSLSLDSWQALTPLQRFALIKLSRPSHENSNFYPALQEFNLV
ncbi:MAG: nitrate reductase associated protein [Microcystaceae cyanobacterium]